MAEEEFDGWTPDQKRAAEKREAALAASRGEPDERAEKTAPPKSRRVKPTDET